MAKAGRKLTDYPKFREAQDKLFEVRQKIRETETQIGSAEKRREEAEKKRNLRTRRAEAILEGKDPDDLGADVPTPESIQEQQDALLDLREAEKIQHKRVEELRHEVSRQICDAVRPDYLRRMTAVAEAGVALSEAAERVFELRDELSGNGVRFEGWLPQVRLDEYRATEPQTQLNRFLDEITKDLSITVARPSLEKAERAREKAHLENEKKKAAAKEAQASEEKSRIKAAMKRAKEAQRKSA